MCMHVVLNILFILCICAYMLFRNQSNKQYLMIYIECGIHVKTETVIYSHDARYFYLLMFWHVTIFVLTYNA